MSEAAWAVLQCAACLQHLQGCAAPDCRRMHGTVTVLPVVAMVTSPCCLREVLTPFSFQGVRTAIPTSSQWLGIVPFVV